MEPYVLLVVPALMALAAVGTVVYVGSAPRMARNYAVAAIVIVAVTFAATALIAVTA